MYLKYKFVNNHFLCFEIHYRLVVLKSKHNRAGKIYDIPNEDIIGRAIVLYEDYLLLYRKFKLEESGI